MVSMEMIRDSIQGNLSSPAFGLESDENSTVLMYLSSHGDPEGDIVFGNGSERINPAEFAKIVDTMHEEKKFGRMLIILESCFGEKTASKITTPDVLVMTASSKLEQSFASTYDPDLSAWLSDEFSNGLVTILKNSSQNRSILELYSDVYHQVKSSHPALVNYERSFPLNTSADVFFGGWAE
jgi:glycosylphosphatidylinositol transamidase (GPIT) subunit GPI8